MRNDTKLQIDLNEKQKINLDVLTDLLLIIIDDNDDVTEKITLSQNNE